MVTFVNNSGVISAFDDSSSPAIETKWLKDNLRVEPYGDYLRLTSVSQNERKAVDYLVTEIVGATSANQIAGVLLGYLEEYGGSGGAFVPLTRNLTIQGVTQDLSADRTFIISGFPISGAAYISQSYTSVIGATGILYIRTVNKVYLANQTNNTVTIYNVVTGELTNTLPLTGAIGLYYHAGLDEIWASTTTSSQIHRINVTATPAGESIFATITGVGQNASGIWNGVVEFSATKSFVSNSASNSVSVINPSTLLTVATIGSVGAGTAGMAQNNNGASLMNGKLVVATNSGMAVIDMATNTLNTTSQNPSSLLATCQQVVYIPSIDRYIVSSAGNQRVVELIPATSTTFTAGKTIRGVNLPSDIVVDVANNLLFVSYISNPQLNIYVGVYNLTTFESLYHFQTGIMQTTAPFRSRMSIDLTTREIMLTATNTNLNGIFVKIKY